MSKSNHVTEYSSIDDALQHIKDVTRCQQATGGNWVGAIHEVGYKDHGVLSIAPFKDEDEEGISIFTLRTDEGRTFGHHIWIKPGSARWLLLCIQAALEELGLHTDAEQSTQADKESGHGY